MARLHHHLRNAFIPHAGNEYRPHALRHHWLGRYAAVLLGVKLLAIAAVSLYAGPVRPSDLTVANIIRLTNKARQERSIAALKTNAALNRAASSKGNDMIRLQYFAHFSPTGRSPWYFFKQAKYSYRYAGENLAIDFNQSEDVVKAWLNSPSHRRNLLSKNYKDIGVAVVRGEINGLQSVIVVQMFGATVPSKSTVKRNVPTQTPGLATARQLLARRSPSLVLGEDDATPPAQPKIVTPEHQSVVRTGTPTIIGSGEPGAEVRLFLDGQVAAIGPVASNGTFTLTPATSWAEGAHTLTVEQTARDMTSAPSAATAITIDTQAPEFVDERTFALPSLLAADVYDVIVAVPDDVTAASVEAGGQSAVLQRIGNEYRGQINIADGQGAPIRATVSDAAGNETTTVLSDPAHHSTGVVHPRDTSTAAVLKVIFFSRAFLMTFLIFMVVASLLNVMIVWQRQHHPTIIGTMLLIYFTTALLLL